MKTLHSAAFTRDRIKLTVILCLSSLFSITLVAFRMYYTYNDNYRFLIWNIFLAFIPYAISTIVLTYSSKINSRLLVIIPVFGWLIFFPNAPYIVTDFFHLTPKDNVPYWYDMGLLFSFSWNGLILGFISLQDIQSVMNRFFGRSYSWILTFISIVLASFGIYLGRFENWNSWDIFTNPLLITLDIADKIINPSGHPRTFLMTILFSAFLSLGYLTFLNLKRPGILLTDKDK